MHNETVATSAAKTLVAPAVLERSLMVMPDLLVYAILIIAVTKR